RCYCSGSLAPVRGPGRATAFARHEARTMRGGMIGLVVVAVGLLGLARAQAGIYSTAEPMPAPELTEGGVQPLSFSRFRNLLADSLNIGVEQPANSRRQHYLARR